MNSNGSRIAAALVAVAVVVGLFFVFKGGSDDNDSSTSTTATKTETTTTDATHNEEKPKEPSVPTITVENGQPVGGITDLTFDKGDDIRFVIESDTEDEVHVHGYDIEEEIGAGGKAEFDFPADLEGIFEVELHGSETQIAELTVNP